MRIIFIEPDGTRREVGGRPGLSLMETAVQNGIVGIEAVCGGACSCATCHVRIGPDWAPVSGTPDLMEEAMLEQAEGYGPGSRLACQIKLRPELDGLVATVVGTES
jgi:ferredoxin, 2Fe-2S